MSYGSRLAIFPTACPPGLTTNIPRNASTAIKINHPTYGMAVSNGGTAP
ncbi:hypothetical protein [Nocardia pseudovaccinii]|nr:hypothetical protein [Nocardia pseudovaccinii]